MRSFQQIVAILFALVAFAFAQSSDSQVYDSTVYITRTVTRVNTITLSGSPSASVANSTSTISASHGTGYAAITSHMGNGTATIKPTGTGAKPSGPQFTGAASALSVNAYIAALAAGVGYLVL